MKTAIKSGHAERIKQLEQELQNMREIKRDKEKLTVDLSNEKEKYHNEKTRRHELE